jgi:hypothetical protein
VSLKRNMLNQSQTFELTTWLRSNWNQIKLEHMTYSKAAQAATDALGFRVSLGNVQGVHEQVNQKLLGDWPTSRPFDRSQKPQKPNTDAAQLDAMFMAIRSLVQVSRSQVEKLDNVERLLEQLVEIATSNQPRKGELFGTAAPTGNGTH